MEESLFELHVAKIKYLQDDVEIITSELESNRIKNESLKTIVNKITVDVYDINMRMDKLILMLQNIFTIAVFCNFF